MIDWLTVTNETDVVQKISTADGTVHWIKRASPYIGKAYPKDSKEVNSALRLEIRTKRPSK